MVVVLFSFFQTTRKMSRVKRRQRKARRDANGGSPLTVQSTDPILTTGENDETTDCPLTTEQIDNLATQQNELNAPSIWTQQMEMISRRWKEDNEADVHKAILRNANYT
jgi:hypothetical protein